MNFSASSYRLHVVRMATVLTTLIVLAVVPRGVSAQSLIVTYPNGGETFHKNDQVTITWNETSISDEIEIEYSVDGGARWRGIDKVNSGVKSVVWDVPGRYSTTVLVRVMTKRGDASDVSDAYFTIEEDPLDQTLLFAPNGGEVWTEGEKQVISWQLPLDAIDALLELSTDGGITWSEIATLPATPAQYQWTIPHISEEVMTNALIRVSVAEAIDHFDISDAPFTLKPKPIIVDPKPAVTMSLPNGGERFAVDSLVRIVWTSRNISGTVDLLFSENGGASWSGVTTIDVAEGSYTWKIPNKVTKAALLKIATPDGTVADTSDALFEIMEKQTDPTVGVIRIISPNGGEIWSTGEQHTISWTAPEDVATVRVELSTNGGVNWQLVDTLAGAAQFLSMTVPDAGSQGTSVALVRISSTVDGNRADLSDAFFEIRSAVAAGFADDDHNDARLNLRVSPNPLSAQGTIQWGQPGGEWVLTVYSLRGERLQSIRHRQSGAGDQSSALIDVSTLPAGSYIVELRTDREVVRQQMIVVH